MSWWKMARASSPPWEPTPHCCCEGRDFSLTERKESAGDIFSQKLFPSEWDGPFWLHFDRAWCALLGCLQRSPALLREIESTRHRQNIFVVGSLSFFRNTSCVLGKNRHSSGRSPVAHVTVRMSRILESRLFRPGPAKAMTACRCSCLSPVCPRALMGANVDMWGARRILSCCVLVLS